MYLGGVEVAPSTAPMRGFLCTTRFDDVKTSGVLNSCNRMTARHDATTLKRVSLRRRKVDLERFIRDAGRRNLG